MESQFSLLIQEHQRFGQMIHPFFIQHEGKGKFTIQERILAEKLEDYGDMLSGNEVKILKLIDAYNDNNLSTRFDNQNQYSRNFVNKVKTEYIEKFIRPFIEKQMGQCIFLAQKEDTPIFYRETKEMVYNSDRVEIEAEPAEIIFNFIKHPNETHYFQTISHQGNIINLNDRNGAILSNEPCWLLLDQKLYHFKQAIEGKKLKAFFDKAFIVVPEKHEKKYYATFIKNCLRDYPVHTEGIEVRKNILKKRPILKLESDFEGLPGLSLYFKYGEAVSRHIDPYVKVVKYLPDSTVPVFEVNMRDAEWEKGIIALLETNNLKIRHYNVFEVKDDRQQFAPVSWINAHNVLLQKHGFEVQQENAAQSFFMDSMQISLDFDEKNDWFDVNAVVKFGDKHEVPLIELRKYLLNDIAEYPLPDGTIAILPPAWFSKYSDLLTFGAKNKKRIRLSRHHYNLVVHSMEETIEVPAFEPGNIIAKISEKEATLPIGINAELRSYQLDGYRWMAFLRKYRLGGILADDMGLGKTLQTLTVLAKHIEETHGISVMTKDLIAGQVDLFSQNLQDKSTGNPSLVIMPASLIHNWQDEIAKFAPHLIALNYTGAQRAALFDRIPDARLILTTYGVIRNDFEELAKIVFDYVILDESQIIKNPASKTARAVFKIHAKYRLALSGTPIENSLSDLWSQMHFLNPGLLRDHNFYKKYFASPIEKNQDEEKQKKLHALILPFILRRTKAEVEQELPQLSEEYIYCELSPEQQTIYQTEQYAIRNHILKNLGQEKISTTAFAVLQALTKLRQMANHPALIDEDYSHGSGKFDEVVRNLETLISEGHKVLVFSSFVKHLEIFTRHFDEQNRSYALLTGQSRNRGEIVKKFQTDPECMVFFISLKAGGVGLNLTEAEYVFILDPWWNPQSENQAVNRAHRIGQTKPVIAYRFISLGTIEEKILKLQRKKSQLAEMFIRTDNPLKDLDADSIKALME